MGLVAVRQKHPSRFHSDPPDDRNCCCYGTEAVKLWLDDVREPWKHGCVGWEWAKTADEAIALLKTGKVERASLDHDLDWDHYPWEDPTHAKQYQNHCGCHVVEWMEEHDAWPPDGCTVHSMNPVGRARMLQVINRHYYGTEATT